MKKLLFCLMCFTITSTLSAQLAPDQNPNYEVSRTKYMAAKDSLLSTKSTTVQNTYKAYDWMQLRQDRRDIRFENRQQRRLNRSLYNGNYGYENYYPYNSYNNQYYRSRYNYNYSNPDISDILWRLFLINN